MTRSGGPDDPQYDSGDPTQYGGAYTEGEPTQYGSAYTEGEPTQYGNYSQFSAYHRTY